MKSRYGDLREFIPVEDNIYKFEGNTMYSRCGGKEHAKTIDYNDLGFFDPDGGPFISEGFPIGDKKVTRIMSRKDGIYFEVK
jgi:hypothetical protein